MRTDPSAPTEAKTSRDEGDHATSYTSRSCAISCVIGTDVEMSHTVQVCGAGGSTGRTGTRRWGGGTHGVDGRRDDMCWLER